MVSEIEKCLLPVDHSFDANTPINERGIKFSWFYDLVRVIDSDFAKISDRFLTTRELVSKYIAPLTAEKRTPLYARVPVEHRGRPTVFISHTWSSYAVAKAHGSLDIVLDHDPDSFVWIDVVCNNQHLVEISPSDINWIIASVPYVAFVLTTEPFWTRSWCLWELICANRKRAKISVYDQILRIKCKYWVSEVKWLPPPFRYQSIWSLSATKQFDQKEILNSIISTFGSVERADEHLSKLISEMLPDHVDT